MTEINKTDKNVSGQTPDEVTEKFTLDHQPQHANEIQSESSPAVTDDIIAKNIQEVFEVTEVGAVVNSPYRSLNQKQLVLFISGVIAVVVIVLIATFYFYKPNQDPVAKQIPQENLKEVMPLIAAQSTDLTQAVFSQITQLSSALIIPEETRVLFLDITTQPIPAFLYLGDKFIGEAPLQKNIEIEKSQINLTLNARFVLPLGNDNKQTVVVSKSFGLDDNINEIKTSLNADIGFINFQNIPQNYVARITTAPVNAEKETSQTNEDPAGLQETDLQETVVSTPLEISNIKRHEIVYVPFGRYHVELVSPENNQAIYKQEYEISSQNQRLFINVSPQQLMSFPINIQTEPKDALIYIDHKLYGMSHLNDTLDLGTHLITVKKEGYTEVNLKIEQFLHTPVTHKIVLDPEDDESLIKQATKILESGNDKKAIELLSKIAEAAEKENHQAQANYLLGRIYSKQKEFDLATKHLKLSQTDKTFANKAEFLMIENLVLQNKKSEALEKLTTFLLQPTNFENKSAQNLFRKISPNKSALIVTTTPAAAKVYVDDKKITDNTPLFLDQTKAQNYPVKVKKKGYKTFSIEKKINPGEFVALKVYLQPKIK